MTQLTSSTYNRALIHSGNIAIWFDPATQWYAPSKGKQGRNQTYSDAAIQRCILMNYYKKDLENLMGINLTVQILFKINSLLKNT